MTADESPSADLVGVALLGTDLIRVQLMLRANAAAELCHFNAMAEQYGGAESWAKEIKKNARWVRVQEYADYHLEDEVSFNAREAKDGLSELSGNRAPFFAIEQKLNTPAKHACQMRVN